MIINKDKFESMIPDKIKEITDINTKYDYPELPLNLKPTF